MLQHTLSSAPCTQQCRANSSVASVLVKQKLHKNRYLPLLVPSATAVAEAQVGAITHPVHPVLPAPNEAHFESDNTVFVEEFRIRGCEAGPDQKANIITIANLLQEVGGNHGVAMWGRSSTGFASMPGMDHLIFVATRMQIHMEAYPMWGDIVRLETYFAEDGRLTTRRDWRLTNAETGRFLGAATSTWVTINTETRRPAKIPEDVKQRFRQLAPSPSRYAIAPDLARKKLPEFVWPAQISAPSQLGRRSDMDPNGHINNVAYLAWALEVIPDNICNDYQLMEVEMDFKAECTAGDQIDCFGMSLTEAADGSNSNSGRNGSSGSNGNAQQFLHLLRKGETDSEVWRARTTWVPLDSSSSNGTAALNGTGMKAATPAAHASQNGAALPSNGTAVAATNGAAGKSIDPHVLHSSSSSNNGKSSAAAAAGSNGAAPAAVGSTSSSSEDSKGGGFLAALAALFGAGGSQADEKDPGNQA